MTAILGVDFGTTNTVLALWDPASNAAIPCHLPGVSTPAGLETQLSKRGTSCIVPSVIRYRRGQSPLIGEQAVIGSSADPDTTACNMKRHILEGSARRQKVADRSKSALEAGTDFMKQLLMETRHALGQELTQLAFAVPAEASADYTSWLRQVAAESGFGRVKLIDEPVAAAFGSGALVDPGEVFGFVDLGAHSVCVQIFTMESACGSTDHRQCRVLGQATAEVGGASIDYWLLGEWKKGQPGKHQAKLASPTDSEILAACREVKERLSHAEEVYWPVKPVGAGSEGELMFTRLQLEAILQRHRLAGTLSRTLTRALEAARERGFEHEHVRHVFLAGGTCLIPTVHTCLEQFFGWGRLANQRPIDGVAAGAAAVAAGVNFWRVIENSYGLRVLDPGRKEYLYHPLVPRGTPFPTRKPIVKLRIRAAFAGQTYMGLAIYEFVEGPEKPADDMELHFDGRGEARVSYARPESTECHPEVLCINERDALLLEAIPPAEKDEARFELKFEIDEDKVLLVSARDLRTGTTLHQRRPLARLT